MVSGAEDLSPVLTAVQFQTSYLNIIVPLFSYLQIGGREIALVSQEKDYNRLGLPVHSLLKWVLL